MVGTAEIESWFQSVNFGNLFDALIFNRILNRNETPLEDKEKKDIIKKTQLYSLI